MRLSRQQWQYGIIDLLEKDDHEAMALLDEAGLDGWELVAVLGREGVVATAYFKRRRDLTEDIDQALGG